MRYFVAGNHVPFLQGEVAVIVITLDEHQVLLATLIATMRHAQNISHPYREQRYGAEWNEINKHIVGCYGECAVAKHFNRFWDGSIGNLKAKDVGTIQVRASELGNPSMILHPADNDEDYFVCASVKKNVVTLIGWLYARDGKQDRYWRTDVRNPAYFIQSQDMNSFRDKP